jgi:hypothetical protein
MSTLAFGLTAFESWPECTQQQNADTHRYCDHHESGDQQLLPGPGVATEMAERMAIRAGGVPTVVNFPHAQHRKAKGASASFVCSIAFCANEMVVSGSLVVVCPAVRHREY